MREMLKVSFVKISALNNSGSRRYFVILFCLSAVFLPDSAMGESLEQSREASLHIVADKMLTKKDGAVVEFIGNVKATRLDSIVCADSMEIYFSEKDTDSGNGRAGNKSAKNRIKKIISTGNVRYSEGDRKAFADKAFYATKEDVLVLTGNSPKLMTGKSFVSGKKITLFRLQDKVIVESDASKKVEALFHPEDNITDSPQ